MSLMRLTHLNNQSKGWQSQSANEGDRVSERDVAVEEGCRG